MKINQNDIRMMNRMLAAEMLLKEALVGSDEEDSNTSPDQCCPCYDIWWRDDIDEDDDEDEVPFMVMIAIPECGFSVMKDSKAERDYPELFPNGNGSKDLTPIPGIEDVYFTFSSQSKKSVKGKTYVSSPVMIMKIDEEAGEFISPDAMDLYKAAEYFNERKSEIRMCDGRIIPAFCLD